MDTLVDIEVRPELIICNTDPSTKPGKHWVLFYFDRDNVEFFDSLGKGIANYGNEFLTFVKRFATTVSENKVRVQAPNTDTCGHYCLYYSYFRCKGKSMKSILFKMQNVHEIKQTVNNLFKLCKKSECNMLQNCISY